jgi:diguanylate cyclase (GGDEF)-like protein
MGKTLYTQETLVTFLEIGKLLTSTLNPDEILEHIMEKGSQWINAENWSLLLKDEASGKLVFEVVVGVKKELLKGLELSPDDGIAAWVAKTGTPEFIPDVSSEPRFNKHFDTITGFTTRSIICYPLKIKDKVTGVIEILNVRDPRVFEPSQMPGIELLADYAAIAIRNSRYVKKIEKMSITDEYTGLYNARYMHSFLDVFFTSEIQTNTISAVFVDLDDFKTIVDTYGHLSGSKVLQEVGAVMQKALPANACLIKYGGDEYVILLPDTDKENAQQITAHVAEAIKKERYLQNENCNIKLTASFGVATCPEDAVTKKELLIAADNALFIKKKEHKKVHVK